jgi:hypothetical protein
MLLLTLRSKKYEVAVEIYRNICGKKFYPGLPDHFHEKWQLLRAHLYYLKFTGHLPPGQLVKDPLGEWRLGKFLNEVEKQSHDKSGYNVSLLALQLLFSIQSDALAIDNRIEAIARYSTRHLQEGGSYRSKYFIRLLLQLSQKSPSTQKVKRQTATWLRKLEDIPVENVDQSFDLEIIPYEDLFRIAVSDLSKKA